jgi:hypothetical protein
MRSVLLLLLIANAAFFAWAQGWLAPALPAPRHSEREPQRLAAQVRPDSVVVLAPQAASAALLAARSTANACLEAGPLSEAEANSTEEALAAALPAGLWVRDKRDAANATSTAAQLWLRVASATLEQQTLLRALPAGFKPCPVRP